MDPFLSPALSGDTWSGLLLVGKAFDGGSHGLALAHGQALLTSWVLPENTKIMLYDAKVDFVDVTPRLLRDDQTCWMQIPTDEQMDWGSIKEVCAGLGCMGLAASFLGLKVIASMDWNPAVIQHLQATHAGEVLCGDINLNGDQLRLHAAGGPVRGVLLSGFPCQPLSTQGDRRGAQDSRAKAFGSTLNIIWRQQMAAAILECVPPARDSDYVQ